MTSGATVTSLRPSFDDATLAQMVVASDPRAPAALWDKYSRLVRGVIARAIGPSHAGDVEDLVQETFIGLFRTLPGLREPSALRSFVVGTALRVTRSELRRRRVRRFLCLTPAGTLPEAAEPAGSDPEARRALRRLYELLDSVEDRGRMAFFLRHVEECGLNEVADALGCSLATAKRALSRAEDRVNAMVKRDPLLASYARTEREEILDAAE
jgi:RNA polymerase sigma-70 factor (ECF subfamily)